MNNFEVNSYRFLGLIIRSSTELLGIGPSKSKLIELFNDVHTIVNVFPIVEELDNELRPKLS